MVKRPKMDFKNFDPRGVKNYKDFRLPENRVEAITKVCHCRMLHGDLDHWHSGLAIAAQLKLTNEQKAWFAMLFGISYRTYWASIVLQKFPDIGNTDPNEIDKWLKAEYKLPDGTTGYNYERVIYGNDCKWNRGKTSEGVQKLTVTIRAIQNSVGSDGLYQYLQLLLQENEAKANKELLDRFLFSIPYYGWMCSWLAAQMLYDFFDFDIDHWKLPFPDNWSSYNSVCYIYDKLDYMTSKDRKPTPEMVEEIHEDFLHLMGYMNEHIPFYVDAYNVESVLCEYRKTAFGPKIKEFNFWNTAEQNILFLESREKWLDEIYEGSITFLPMLIGQMTKRGYCKGAGYDKRYFRIVSETGMLQNIDQTYPELPDVYSYLDIPRPEEVQIDLINEMWDSLPTIRQKSLEVRFNPELMLRSSRC